VAALEQEFAQYRERYRGEFIEFAHNDVMRIKLFYGVVEKSDADQFDTRACDFSNACPQVGAQDHRMTASAYGRLGVRWEIRGDDIFVPPGQDLTVQEGLQGEIPRIHDAPWPGFPADLTSIALVLATIQTALAFFAGQVLESAATCKVRAGVRSVLPPASTVCGGILNAPALSGMIV